MCLFFYYGFYMLVFFDFLLVIFLVMLELFWLNWVEDKENVVLFWFRWFVKLFKCCIEFVFLKVILLLIWGIVCGRKVNFCLGCKFVMVGWFICVGFEELVVIIKGEW